MGLEDGLGLGVAWGRARGFCEEVGSEEFVEEVVGEVKVRGV